MTALEGILRRLIEEEGPIDVARFMALALNHPKHGYYRTRDPLGGAGDFVTAPEVSQVFGELIGVALAGAWLEGGSPSPFALVEIGPGRGTLMADLLRATARVPGFHAALTLHLVETNPILRQAQRGALRYGAPVWHDGLATLPADRPLFVVANEFLDALPVRQYVRAPRGWRERKVGLDEAGRLTFGLDRRPMPFGTALSPAKQATPLDGLIELAPAREAFTADLAARLAAAGGLALLIDYGEADLGHGDTLQAVAGHRPVDPLANPGAADLTSRVDFAPLAAAARRAGIRAFGPLPQGVFLERLGIKARLARLAATAPSRREALAAGVERLVAPAQMGALFKVLALVAGDAIPPGFLPEEEAADAA